MSPVLRKVLRPIRGGVLGAAGMLGALVALDARQDAQPDPFAFFSPTAGVSTADRARLDAGEVVVRKLPGDPGQLAIFAAARLNASAGALIAWTRAIEDLKRNAYVLQVQRFSNPPVLDDLSSLTLDEGDLEAIRKCQPGDCEVKLTAADIETLRATIASAGASWKDAVQVEFRRRLLARVVTYLRDGLPGLAAYADRGRTAGPRDVLASIVARSPYLTRGLPSFASTLVAGGAPSAEDVESLVYWSKERYGAGKNVVTITHSQMIRPAGGRSVPEVMVAGKQIFATHYSNGALGITAVVCATPSDCYVSYVNRTQTDLLGGVFGGLRRAIMEQRLESETPSLLRDLRRRLESGDPP